MFLYFISALQNNDVKYLIDVLLLPYDDCKLCKLMECEEAAVCNIVVYKVS